MVFINVFFSTNLVLLGLVWSFVKFGKVLIDGCSDTCYNKKLIETFRQIGHKKSKPNENTSDHFIVSKEILETDSIPSLFHFIGVTDRHIFYQNLLSEWHGRWARLLPRYHRDKNQRNSKRASQNIPGHYISTGCPPISFHISINENPRNAGPEDWHHGHS